MNKFLMMVLAFSLLSLGVASASSIPCAINGSDAIVEGVTSTTSVTCGGLTFDNFEVLNATGGAPGIVDITGVGPCANEGALNQVCLSFNPNLQADQDEALEFQVWGGIDQIDMSVGGEGASVTETACSVAEIDGVCPQADLLGEITVQSNEEATICSLPECTNITPTSPVYVYKNINVQTGALSEFNQSFDPSPEPVSMILLGSGLLGLGLLRRRSRKS
jgi:hypothetical protein